MDTNKGLLKKSLSLVLIIISLVFCVSCGRLGNAKAELIGQNKTIVYNGVRYAPLDGLSCWMWSDEGMEYVGKYESLAFFNNSVSNVYAPVSNDSDPRLYAEAYASGYIRWLKEGSELPSPMQADLTEYQVLMGERTFTAQITAVKDVVDPEAGIDSNSGMSYIANIKLYLKGFGDTYYSGKLYNNNGTLYLCDEGYSNKYYPVTDEGIIGFVLN